MTREDNITRLSIPYAIWILALPSSLKFIGHFLFEVVDAFWVGQLGKDALAAVGGTSLYIWAYFALMQLTLSGSNALIAQAIGSSEKEKSLRIAGTGVFLSFLCSLVLLAFYGYIKEDMLRILGLKGRAYVMGNDYLTTFIVAAPIYYLWGIFEEIINARGQTQVNLFIVGICILINLVLDPFLIYGYGPFPRWEVIGAQVASIVSATTGLVLSFCFCVRKGYFTGLSCESRLFVPIFKIGVPRACGDLFFCLTYVGLSHLIEKFGNEALAAWMVCHRLEGFAYFIGMGFSTSAMTMVGQYKGAMDPRKAVKSVRSTLFFVSFLLSIDSIVLFFLGEKMVSFFTQDPLVLQYGGEYLRIVALTHVLLGWEIVLGGAFVGTGNTFPHMSIVAPLTFARIPASYWLIPYWGIAGVYWAISISTLLKGMALCIWFFSAMRTQIYSKKGESVGTRIGKKDQGPSIFTP